MWSIQMKCVALEVICLLQGSPDLGKNSFTTYRDCERSLIRIVEDWKPARGAYTFNCRKVG